MIKLRSARARYFRTIASAILFTVSFALLLGGCGIFGARPVVDNADVELREIRDPDIHFVPTPQDVVDKMLELADVNEDDLIYDLGCGDGRIVVTAAERYGCRGVGYDIDPERVIDSMKNEKKNNVEHLVRIEQRDVFTLDLSDASVITLYLLPSLNVKLIPQLKKLKPGTRIVSHDFDMRGVKPDRVITIEDDDQYGNHTIYLWTAPLNITVAEY